MIIALSDQHREQIKIVYQSAWLFNWQDYAPARLKTHQTFEERVKDWNLDLSWGYFEEDKLAGFIKLDQINKHCILLDKLYIDPDQFGKHIATKLLENAIKWSCDHDYQEMQLWCEDNNIAALNLYAKAGFSLSSAKPRPFSWCELIDRLYVLNLKQSAH